MYKKISFSLLFITVIALFFRVIFLDRIPTGASNDEIDYLLNAKSVFLSGSDISHTWNPLSFTSPKSSFPQAEIAPLIMSPFIGPLPLGLSTSKLPYALFSVGIVVLIYLLTKKLIGKNEAIAAGLVASMNPWLIFFGRSAYDTTLAVFFFLLGFYILLLTKKWHILYAFFAFFAGFYAYIGTKLLFLPFVAVTIFYTWSINQKYKKQYVVLFLLCIGILVYYLFSLTHSSGTRLNELANPNMSSIAQSVNFERKLSIHSPLVNIFSNKYVVFGKYMIDKYLNTFSPNFLFLYGDAKQEFTLWTHGVFYYIDAIFLLIGLVVLFTKNKRVFALLVGLILIAPIPSVLSTVGTSYAIRSMLLAPLFIILIGVGLSYVVKRFPYIKIPICFLYIVLVANFINIYFLRNPLYNSESFNFSRRELAKYLSFQSKTVYVIDSNPQTPYKQYLFYNNYLQRNSSGKIARDYKNNSFSMNTIHFITCAEFEQTTMGTNTVVYDTCKNVPRSNQDISIAQLSDAGTLLTIHNDHTCSSYTLTPYPYGITFSDLAIEKLSQPQFCTKFITH